MQYELSSGDSHKTKPRQYHYSHFTKEDTWASVRWEFFQVPVRETQLKADSAGKGVQGKDAGELTEVRRAARILVTWNLELRRRDVCSWDTACSPPPLWLSHCLHALSPLPHCSGSLCWARIHPSWSVCLLCGPLMVEAWLACRWCKWNEEEPFSKGVCACVHMCVCGGGIVKRKERRARLTKATNVTTCVQIYL